MISSAERLPGVERVMQVAHRGALIEDVGNHDIRLVSQLNHCHRRLFVELTDILSLHRRTAAELIEPREGLPYQHHEAGTVWTDGFPQEKDQARELGG